MKIITTNKDVNLKEEIIEVSKNSSYEMDMIKVYPTVTYQTYMGMGGALTEATAYTYSRMSKENQKNILHRERQKIHSSSD